MRPVQYVWILLCSANISASQGQQASKLLLRVSEPSIPIDESNSSSAETQSLAIARRMDDTADKPYEGEACATEGVGDHECLFAIASSTADIFKTLGKFAVKKANGQEIETEEIQGLFSSVVDATAAIAPLFLPPPWNSFAVIVAPIVGGLISSFLGLDPPDEMEILQNKLQGYVERRLIEGQLSRNSYRLQALSDEFTWTKGLFINPDNDSSIDSARLAWLFTAQHSMAADAHLFLSTECMTPDALPTNFSEIGKNAYCSTNVHGEHRLHKSAKSLKECTTACLEDSRCEYLSFYAGEKGPGGSDDAFCRLSQRCTELKATISGTRVLQKSLRVNYTQLFKKTDNTGTECIVNEAQGKAWYVGDRGADTITDEECKALALSLGKDASCSKVMDGNGRRKCRCTSEKDWYTDDTITEEECKEACSKDASCRYVTYDHRNKLGWPRCKLTSECIAVRYHLKPLLQGESNAPTTVWQKKFLTGATQSCQEWRRAVVPAVTYSYASLHLSVLADIMGDKQEFRQAALCQMVTVGLRYLTHLRLAFAEFLENALSNLKSAEYDEKEGQLSGGYDLQYGSEGAECGQKEGYDPRCDILVQKCNAPIADMDWGWYSSQKRFFKMSKASAWKYLRCFDDYKRDLANRFSKSFELTYHSLKTEYVDYLLPFCEKPVQENPEHAQVTRLKKLKNLYSPVVAR